MVSHNQFCSQEDDDEDSDEGDEGSSSKSSSSGANGGKKCECAVGSLVRGRKCEVSKEFLVFTTRTEIRSEHIDREGDSKEKDETSKPFNPIQNMTNVVGIDFDYEAERL